jgi:hypothetical protein
MILIDSIEKVLGDMRNADARTQAEAVISIITSRLTQVGRSDPWLYGSSNEVLRGIFKALEER